MKMNRPGICASILVLALAPLARGGADNAGIRPAVAPVLFPKGTFTLQTYAAYAGGIDRHDQLATGTVGVGYYLWDNISLSLEASGGREFVPGPDTHDAWGFGLSGVFRNHLITYERSTLFADVAFGPLQSTARIPSGGTEFNFAFRSGFGTTYQLDDHLHLLAGVRYFHISNAHLEGPRRNPSLNGLEGYLGVMWTF